MDYYYIWVNLVDKHLRRVYKGVDYTEQDIEKIESRLNIVHNEDNYIWVGVKANNEQEALIEAKRKFTQYFQSLIEYINS